MANQVALTSDNIMFLGLPRYARQTPTPSMARREPGGTLVPFPGDSWNDWKPGDDGRDAFVYLNSVHIFADDMVWCVDQGSLSEGIFPSVNATLASDAQKLIQLDPRSGRVLTVLRFDETILPPGAQMNDLRMHGSLLYVTDSGLGGLIVHDLATGKTMRRLSGDKVVRASLADVPEILAHVKGGETFRPPNSDMIEITADGKWLYWAAPTGPLYRVETRYLKDEAVSDAELAAHVEHVFDNNFSGGCAMDSLGNVYFSETVTRNITVLSPSGKTAVLVSDPTLVRPDGSFISRERRLYIPIKQPVESGIEGPTADEAPFVTYAVSLPESLDGIPLGGPVTGS
ncbi:L-dopachrome tautomerase-related protein [Mycobacterium sp. GA-1841]|uniref:L-dopachrome tautomerase-related protein n=1 Tax=Mycobacterium sp. GA-1841 TaxID=1834154 RepID=UPI001C37B309|nr:L-dopachrome tautomerase-related protein [Mycobacterium sp. GA-1841]